MPTANEQLRDRILRHDVGLQRLATSTTRKILGLLADAERDVTRQIRTRLAWIADRGYDASDFTLRRLEANLREIRRGMREAYGALGRELRSDLVTLAKNEAADQVGLLTGVLPDQVRVRLSVMQPAAEELRAIVESRPFQGALLKDWGRQLEVSAYTKVRGAIRQGMLQGESIDAIVRRVRGTRAAGYRDGILEMTRREAETVVRTAVAHVAQTVRDDTYAENADLIRSQVWLGTLDSRTCVNCGRRDGLEYDLDHRPIGHAVPWEAGPGRLHHRDRCVSVPRLKSWRELGIDAGEVEPGTRASMNGQVPSTTSFGDWIAGQPAAVQDEVLGVTRARALRAGTATFPEFFDAKGRGLSVPQLRAKGLIPAPKPAQPAALLEPIRGSKAEMDRLHAAISEGVWAEDEHDRGVVKAGIVKDLTDRIMKSPDFSDQPRRQVEQDVQALVNQWAKSSGDNDGMSCAVQIAAKEDFGIAASSLDHLGKRGLFEGQRILDSAFERPGLMIPGMATRSYGGKRFVGAFLRAQYEATQEWFAARGIREVTMLRGATYANEVAEGLGDLRLQPLSSFSASLDTAGLFADSTGSGGAMHVVRIPVSQVLSTARTGVGCLSEYEVVVMGGPTRGFTVAPRGLQGDDLTDEIMRLIRRFLEGDDA